MSGMRAMTSSKSGMASSTRPTAIRASATRFTLIGLSGRNGRRARLDQALIDVPEVAQDHPCTGVRAAGLLDAPQRRLVSTKRPKAAPRTVERPARRNYAIRRHGDGRRVLHLAALAAGPRRARSTAATTAGTRAGPGVGKVRRALGAASSRLIPERNSSGEGTRAARRYSRRLPCRSSGRDTRKAPSSAAAMFPHVVLDCEDVARSCHSDPTRRRRAGRLDQMGDDAYPPAARRTDPSSTCEQPRVAPPLPCVRRGTGSCWPSDDCDVRPARQPPDDFLADSVREVL